MNLHVPVQNLTTQAAEGLPRRKWSVSEIEALVESGVLREDERFELIGGEIVPMSPKGIRHEIVKAKLNLFWAKKLPAEISFVTETTFRLDEFHFVEPDFVFFREQDGLRNLSPRTALLAVEVALSSLAYDLGRKLRIYANFGIRSVWVIDAKTLVCHQHAAPGLDGYTVIEKQPQDAVLVPDFAPALAGRLCEIIDEDD
jgi:Uma2 family endonuclease